MLNNAHRADHILALVRTSALIASNAGAYQLNKFAQTSARQQTLADNPAVAR